MLSPELQGTWSVEQLTAHVQQSVTDWQSISLWTIVAISNICLYTNVKNITFNSVLFGLCDYRKWTRKWNLQGTVMVLKAFFTHVFEIRQWEPVLFHSNLCGIVTKKIFLFGVSSLLNWFLITAVVDCCHVTGAWFVVMQSLEGGLTCGNQSDSGTCQCMRSSTTSHSALIVNLGLGSVLLSWGKLVPYVNATCAC